MYQTEKEVRQAAVKSERAAILSSIRHWNEILIAKPNELILAELYCGFGFESLSLGPRTCALCVRVHSNCFNCPIVKAENIDCCDESSVYHDAWIAFQNFKYAPVKSDRDAAVKRFRRRARKMIKLLESLLC